MTPTGGCPAGVEYTLTTLQNGVTPDPWSIFAGARAATGVDDGDTTMLVGVGDWTNTYVHPCKVYIYSYNLANDTWTNTGTSIADVAPTATYSGSQPSISRVDTDRSVFFTRHAGGNPGYIWYFLDAPSVGNYLYVSGTVPLAIIAIRGTSLIHGSDGTFGATALKRYTLAGVLQATSPSTARSWQTLHVHKDLTYVYGILAGGATIYKYDVSTLTEQTSFAVPAGGSATAKLLSHANNPNIWWCGLVSGTKKIYERVESTWVERFSGGVTSAFNDSTYSYLQFEGSTLWCDYHASSGGTGAEGAEIFKIEPLGCNM